MNVAIIGSGGREHAICQKLREDNKKLIWKMKRFSLYLWERIEQEKKGYLWLGLRLISV